MFPFLQSPLSCYRWIPFFSSPPLPTLTCGSRMLGLYFSSRSFLSHPIPLSSSTGQACLALFSHRCGARQTMVRASLEHLLELPKHPSKSYFLESCKKTSLQQLLILTSDLLGLGKFLLLSRNFTRCSTAALAVALWKRAPDKKALHCCRIESP